MNSDWNARLLDESGSGENDRDVVVEIVRAHVGAFKDLGRLAETLSDDERSRAHAYRFQESSEVFTLARGLLRTELSKRLGAPAHKIQFDLRPSGKPDVRKIEGITRDWRFSVSHTGPHVAIAFAAGIDVGIDIERTDRAVNALAIARRYFTPEELSTLETLPADALTRGFFAGWTRKEAIVKARGQTMADSLATLTVDLDPKATHPRSKDAPTAPPRPHCHLTSFEFHDPKLIGAVALLSGRPPRLSFEILSGATFD